jgi:hypothetical protein
MVGTHAFFALALERLANSKLHTPGAGFRQSFPRIAETMVLQLLRRP